jgi:DNA polymerase V
MQECSMSTHGGSRPGAGRKVGSNDYGEPTQPIRVPLSVLPTVQHLLTRLKAQRRMATYPDGVLLPDLTAAKVELPLFAHRVPAGFPSPADDYIDQRLDLNDHLVNHPAATFFVRVQGHSMQGASINDGDLLIVDRAIDPVDGKVVIAAVNGELTVKRLMLRNGQAWLQPENPAYAPLEIIEGLDCVIWGVVTNVIHKL